MCSSTMAGNVDMVFANKEVVKTYALFRSPPPKDLILRIVEFTKENLPSLKLCLDVGCGSGQATKLVADHFEHVIGIDVSQPHIEIASQRNTLKNITYKVEIAENLPAENGCVDLVNACNSAHWVDIEKLYIEVDRVLRPGGVLACYSHLGCSPFYGNINLRNEFMEIWHSFDRYWAKGFQHCLMEYESLPRIYPEDLHLTNFSDEQEGTLETLLGYIKSWSAYSKMKEAEGKEAAQEFLEKSKHKLLSAMDTDSVDPQMKWRYDYYLRIFRKPTS